MDISQASFYATEGYQIIMATLNALASRRKVESPDPKPTGVLIAPGEVYYDKITWKSQEYVVIISNEGGKPKAAILGLDLTKIVGVEMGEEDVN